MDKMQYRSFVWPNNPHTYRETFSREAKFRTTDGVTSFVGMSEGRRVITGSGVFFGEDAYAQFKLLREEFLEGTQGLLTHPVWGSCFCNLTELTLTQEPKENCVSYSFAFIESDKEGNIPA